MRDALSLLDQCIAFYLGQKLTYDKVLEVLGTVDTEIFSQMLRTILAGDVTGSIRTLETLLNRGKELGQFVTDFTWYLRNLLLVKSADETEELLNVSTENLKLLKEESTMVDDETLIISAFYPSSPAASAMRRRSACSLRWRSSNSANRRECRRRTSNPCWSVLGFSKKKWSAESR